jgi:DNA-binding CsgD family transcriptional regulator
VGWTARKRRRTIDRVTRVEAPTLIGRKPELTRLGDWVADVAAGRGRAVLIDGEPGIGKTALVRLAAERSVELGCQVLWAAADELDQAFPLQPLIDALSPHEAYRADVLARLHNAPASAMDSRDAITAAAEGLLAAIDELCAVSPVMLVLDDLQWADDATLSLWDRLVRAAQQMPLLLVGAVRPLPRRDTVAAARAAVTRDHQIHLTGLSAPAVAELVAAFCRATPGDGLTRLAAGASGNPLYLTELLDALERNGTLRIDADGLAEVAAGPVPASLSEAIADRLQFLAAPVRDVLRTAALLGPDFSVEELAIVADRPAGDLVALLRQAYAGGVLTDHDDAVSFRHPLIRTALYQDEPAAVRAAWHRSAAHALAAAKASPERVARQLIPALSGSAGSVVDEWMLDWLAANALLMIAQSPSVAVSLLERAVAATRLGDDYRDLLGCRLAEALRRCGRADEARHVAQQILDQTTNADLVVGLCEILTISMWSSGHNDDVAPMLALALGRDDLSAAQRDMLRIIDGREHMYEGPEGAEAAVAVATEALASADATERRLQAWALTTLADANVAADRPDLALEAYDRAFALMAGDPALVDVNLLAMGNRALMLVGYDRITEGAQAAEALRQAAETGGNPLRLNQAVRALATALYFGGHWDEALIEIETLLAGDGAPELRIQSHAVTAFIAMHRGLTDMADGQMAAGWALGEDVIGVSDIWLCAQILHHERAGAVSMATTVFSAAAASNRDSPWRLCEVLAEGTRLAMLVGDPELVALCGQVTEVAAASDMPFLHTVAVHCRGLIDRDPELLTRAAERYRHSGRVLPRARALDAAALLLIERGEAAAARDAYTVAFEIYTALDAGWDIARLDADLRERGVHRGRTGPRRRPSHGWDSLTPTEVRVAGLVAQGQSNPRIADALFLSRRTVQTHVAHILGKLDIHSRVDIAREVVRRQAAQP